jgi:hypothetical protein
MSNNPRSNLTSPRLARGGAVAFALASALGCTAYATYKPPVPPDCSVMNAYDIDNIDAELTMAWSSKDNTDGSISTDAGTIPGGPLCGDGNVLVVKGDHSNDWGSLFGFYSFGKKDESTREGLSFWARAPGNTGKGFTILLDDPNTYAPYAGAACTADAGSVPPGDGGSFCTTYCTLDAGAGGTPPTYGPDGTLLSSGTSVAPSPPNACGNEYQTEVVVTRDWQFYTIPFDQFQQPAKPNRVPNAVFTETGSAPGTPLMTSAILNMIFRFPKESAEDLWLSHLGFYRKKAADAGVDRCSGC